MVETIPAQLNDPLFIVPRRSGLATVAGKHLKFISRGFQLLFSLLFMHSEELAPPGLSLMGWILMLFIHT